MLQSMPYLRELPHAETIRSTSCICDGDPMTIPEQYNYTKKAIAIAMAQELYPMDVEKRRAYVENKMRDHRYHAGRVR